MTIKKFIWITTQKELIHQYHDAPEDVEFLKHPHRHLFKFKIKIEVGGDDREIEFIMFKRYIEKLLSRFKNLENKSCEMLSNELHRLISKKYVWRDMEIEVSEDGENGSYIIYEVNK